MNTEQMLKRIHEHPIMCELGAEMVMGFPQYEVRSQLLYARFMPHRERVHGDGTVFFRPAYILEFAFPFRHLSRFDNRVLEGFPDAGMAAIHRKGAAFQQRYDGAAAEVHKRSDEILEATGLRGHPSAQQVADYQRALYEELRALEILDIYALEGGEACS